jgi:FdhD protein
VLTSRWDGSSAAHAPDQVIVEEPLEIRLDGARVTTTMRTPGNDFELAAGFCHTAGLRAGAAIRACRYCGTGSAIESEFNVVSVDTGSVAPSPTPRLTTVTSSCGMCGSAEIDELRERLRPLPATDPWPYEILAAVPSRVVDAQDLFTTTGAVHAAAAFDRGGEPVLLREDIGRHNAVDKVVGRLLLDGALPAHGVGLYVSGRASFEIVQKAWAAGLGVIVAVSAPSSLAVSAAVQAGITLCGFVREGRMNVYTG